MPQIGQLLVEYTDWLKDQQYMSKVQDEAVYAVGTDMAVARFLDHIERREWMPTTGAEGEEAEPEPEDGPHAVDIDAIIDYCESVVLNPAANASARLKAAEVIIRWADYTTYNEGVERDRNADGSPNRDWGFPGQFPPFAGR
jgi:hypothetical protein